MNLSGKYTSALGWGFAALAILKAVQLAHVDWSHITPDSLINLVVTVLTALLGFVAADSRQTPPTAGA